MSEVTFTLNDAPVTAAYTGKETLLQYLRNVKCLKGTKEACGTGHCGACSVLIDGKLARSCVTPLRTLAGKHVETIENAAKDGALSVIQRSFLDAGVVDELSLVIAPVTDGSQGSAAVFAGIPGLNGVSPVEFSLKEVRQTEGGGVYLRCLAKNAK